MNVSKSAQRRLLRISTRTSITAEVEQRRFNSPTRCASGLLALCLFAASVAGTPAASQTKPAAVITETREPEIDTILNSSLTIPLLLERPFAEGTDLSLAIKAETERLTETMKSLGYLSARIEVHGAGTRDDPLVFTPHPGDLYRVGAVRIGGLEQISSQTAIAAIRGLISSHVGTVAKAETLELLGDEILFVLRDASYGFASLSAPEMVVNPRTKTTTVVYTAELGDPLVLGSTIFTGSFKISDAEVAALVPYRFGAPYSPLRIEALRSALEDTNHFRRIRIALAATPGSAGVTDVHVDLADRPPAAPELARSSGLGPGLLALALMMIVLMEATRVTSLWNHAVLRNVMTSASLLMVTIAVPVVILRLLTFMP